MTNDKHRIASRLGLALFYLLTLLCLGGVSYYSLTEWRGAIARQVNLQQTYLQSQTASTAPEIAERQQLFEQQLLQQAVRETKVQADNAIAICLASFSLSAIGFLLVFYLLNLQLQRELAERQRAEEALRQAETKYRSIFENAIEGIFQTTPEGRYLTANPMLAKIYGYSSTAELMANISDLGQQLYVNPHRREEFIRLLQQHDTVVGFESQVYRQDGQVIWIAEQARIVRDDRDKPLYYEGIVEDITQRKQAEEERAKLISILEATLDFVATADLDERVHYLNSSARKVFGLGLDRDRDVTDLHLSNFHPAWAYDLLHREAIPTAIQNGVWIGETAILSHDGREIPVSQLLIAHKSSQGKVKLLSTIARDITQRLQIEASLREAERRWRSLLENVRLVVVGLDRQGIVEYVNPCFLELVEYTSEEVLGKNWYEVFLPPHQRQRVQEHFFQLQQQGLHNYYQNSILTKSGQERLIAWNNTILRDLQGEAIATLSIGEDITERYAIERMKDEFVSVVSHELRTPLTSIHGALNLLSSGLIDAHSDRGRRVIDIASEGADRLVRLVNDILELERLESGKISLIQRSCHAAELLEKATDLMQVVANRAKVTLAVFSQDIQLYADGDRIIQVLTNLLGNAIKFSPEGSKVELSVEAIGSEFSPPAPSAPSAPLTNYILFTVKDRGRGIPADKIESIFERFHQVDASDSRKKGGTGLGLAICRSIIQQHGGRIWAESVLGEGSSFYFTLPKLNE